MTKTPLLVLLALALTAPAQPGETVQIDEQLNLTELAPGIWWHESAELRFPVTANGLLAVTEQGAVMIDTPWTEGQTGQLFDWVKERFGVEVKLVVPSHYHIDCMGGLAEAHRRGAKSYALDRTVEIARREGLAVPNESFDGRQTLGFGGLTFEVRYFGPGHTSDNTVVWIPERNVLFGGDLVRSQAVGKGNLAEADQKSWPDTVRAMKNAYPDVHIVVPGHGKPGGPELLDYTLELFTAAE